MAENPKLAYLIPLGNCFWREGRRNRDLAEYMERKGGRLLYKAFHPPPISRIFASGALRLPSLLLSLR